MDESERVGESRCSFFFRVSVIFVSVFSFSFVVSLRACLSVKLGLFAFLPFYLLSSLIILFCGKPNLSERVQYNVTVQSVAGRGPGSGGKGRKIMFNGDVSSTSFSSRSWSLSDTYPQRLSCRKNLACSDLNYGRSGVLVD